MRTMLVAIDFSDSTPSVVKIAGDYAEAGGFRVHLLHVLPEEAELVGYETGIQILPPAQPLAVNTDNVLMETCRHTLQQRGIEVTSQVVEGAPAMEIAEQAEVISADLIVMGSHRHGVLYHLFLGSTSEGVIRRVSCPVLIVPVPVIEDDGGGKQRMQPEDVGA